MPWSYYKFSDCLICQSSIHFFSHINMLFPITDPSWLITTPTLNFYPRCEIFQRTIRGFSANLYFFFNESLQLPACPWARANILADQQLFLSCEKIDVYVLSLWTTPPYMTDDVKILLISHCRQFHVREIRKIPRNTKNARIGR